MKCNISIIIILFISFIQGLHSQPDTVWTKTYGGIHDENISSVVETFDREYLIVGYTESYGSGGKDIWLVKINTTGDTIWTKTYGGADYDHGFSILKEESEGYIIAGSTLSYGIGLVNAWLIKTDESGDTLWANTYGGNGADDFHIVLKEDDNTYITAGISSSFSENPCIWINNINTDGIIIWTKIISTIYNSVIPNALVKTHNGELIIGGLCRTNGPDTDFLVIKLSEDINDISSNNNLNAESFTFLKNYPNPFNTYTKISFGLIEKSHVQIQIYNILGQNVAEVLNYFYQEGTYNIIFNAQSLSSGVYIVKAVVNSFGTIKNRYNVSKKLFFLNNIIFSLFIYLI